MGKESTVLKLMSDASAVPKDTNHCIALRTPTGFFSSSPILRSILLFYLISTFDTSHLLNVPLYTYFTYCGKSEKY